MPTDMTKKDQTLHELVALAIDNRFANENQAYARTTARKALDGLCKACGLSLEVLEQIRSGDAVILPIRIDEFTIDQIAYKDGGGSIDVLYPLQIQLNTPIPEENK